ncbi:MAG: phospho-sugar mutase [Pirellulales bacterium]|nr:phospho-sugar mutase [Pirellulales bacterium]
MESPIPLSLLAQARETGKISATAEDHLRAWLTEARYAEYVPAIQEHVEQGKWKELDDAFWTGIPFGTGGRRGRMYPIGPATINDRTIGESAQGLAEYVLELRERGEVAAGRAPRCAIAYDTRHRSRHFAELCTEILAAAGFDVYFLDGYRSTPELSVAVRHTESDCGIMVTASHNPPSDNAVKVYWSTGGQVLPPHDAELIKRVTQVQELRRKPFQAAVREGQVHFCQDEIDEAYVSAVVAQAEPGPRDLKALYSTMHGVGASSVVPVLKRAGFDDCELFGPHAEPDGSFPNVPGHVSNPENPATFDSIIQQAEAEQADLVMSTDPDADRLGAAARLSPAGNGWRVLTGNQIGALLCDFLLARAKEANRLNERHYVVKTLVTTELIATIAEHYGVRTEGNLQVGFKWIGQVIDQQGPDGFLFGAEESHGYLAGTYARDKDAAVAALHLAELAAVCKANGKSLHQRLDELYLRHGVFAEGQVSQPLPGAQGMQLMKELMRRFRESPPTKLAGLKVARLRDYKNLTVKYAEGSTKSFSGPPGDLVFLDLEPAGNSVAIRPSGTEPKVKFYLFAKEPVRTKEELAAAKAMSSKRISELTTDLQEYVR